LKFNYNWLVKVLGGIPENCGYLLALCNVNLGYGKSNIRTKYEP
jgi:hypothetical protein